MRGGVTAHGQDATPSQPAGAVSVDKEDDAMLYSLVGPMLLSTSTENIDGIGTAP